MGPWTSSHSSSSKKVRVLLGTLKHSLLRCHGVCEDQLKAPALDSNFLGVRSYSDIGHESERAEFPIRSCRLMSWLARRGRLPSWEPNSAVQMELSLNTDTRMSAYRRTVNRVFENSWKQSRGGRLIVDKIGHVHKNTSVWSRKQRPKTQFAPSFMAS